MPVGTRNGAIVTDSPAVSAKIRSACGVAHRRALEDHVKRLCRPASYVMPVLLCTAWMFALPIGAADQGLDPSPIRDAATRGYAAIQVAQKASRTSQTCATTCHLQAYGAFASRAMYDRGLRLDDHRPLYYRAVQS